MSAPSVRVGRRQFLAGAVSLGLWPLAPPLLRHAVAQPRWSAYPFSLGVASGYPVPTGVVLWTRLAPAPSLPGGGMPREAMPVEWEVAADEGMGRIVQRGTAAATPDWAHSVHVEVGGLEPARWYWYRFRAGGEVSPVGRTRTAPPANAALDRLRFAFASCQHWELGHFNAYRSMVADDLDLLVFLGDYIYEYSTSLPRVRQHGTPEAITLDDYRLRYALYKSDPDLRAAHAACPWIVTWDDHEVANDYADDRSAQLHPREWFLRRRAAGYQAFYEHMPLRRQMVPLGPHARIYHRAAFGDLVQFHVLDDRQYRSYQPCVPAGAGGSAIGDCPERVDPRLTILGETQERWLEDGLNRSRATWNVLAQQTLVAQLDRKPGAGQQFRTDGWDGYPAARRRLLEHIEVRKPGNPVLIGGDVHSFWVTDLKPDFDDPRSPVVATELVSTSITSQMSRALGRLEALLPDNPHVKFADGARRGYVRVELTRARLRADLRAMRTVAQPRSEAETLATFVVDNGRPGAVRA
jgi:alkaline phosphatase D